MSAAGGQAARWRPAASGVVVEELGALLDYGMLSCVGWDAATLVWKPDPSHPVLGFRCCGVDGCGYPADTAEGLCAGCDATRVALGGDDMAAFCRAGVQRRQWSAE